MNAMSQVLFPCCPSELRYTYLSVTVAPQKLPLSWHNADLDYCADTGNYICCLTDASYTCAKVSSPVTRPHLLCWNLLCSKHWAATLISYYFLLPVHLSCLLCWHSGPIVVECSLQTIPGSCCGMSSSDE